MRHMNEATCQIDIRQEGIVIEMKEGWTKYKINQGQHSDIFQWNI